MTMAIGSQSGHMKKSARNDNGRGGSGGGAKSNSSSSGGGGGGSSGVGSSGNNGVSHCESESDTSISPSTEFSNMPTYRVPCKSRNSDGRSGVGVYSRTRIHTYIHTRTHNSIYM